MTHAVHAWPNGHAPAKEEIERMYRIAYFVDDSILRPDDVLDFGLDVHRLRDHGEVHMGKGVSVLRRHVQKLWERMTQLQRSAFVISDILFQIAHMKGAAEVLGKISGPCAEIQDGIGMIENGLFTYIPKDLRVKLDAAFEKWRSGAVR